LNFPNLNRVGPICQPVSTSLCRACASALAPCCQLLPPSVRPHLSAAPIPLSRARRSEWRRAVKSSRGTVDAGGNSSPTPTQSHEANDTSHSTLAYLFSPGRAKAIFPFRRFCRCSELIGDSHLCRSSSPIGPSNGFLPPVLTSFVESHERRGFQVFHLPLILSRLTTPSSPWCCCRSALVRAYLL
jgi:hypothetical protein